MITFILSIIAYAIFVAYTILVFSLFGVPSSYSATFYLLNEKKKGLGILFPLMSALVVFLVMPNWFVLSDSVLPLFTWLCFFAGGGLLLVAASPFFKEQTKDCGSPLKDLIYRSFHGQGLVHTIGALLAMISSVTWMILGKYYLLLIGWLVIVLVIMFSLNIKKQISNITFWVEFLIFNLILSLNILN